jgi:DNA-binding response OmpR family regulator
MGGKAPAILIVDDNVEFADLLGTLFAEQGLVPVLAHTAHNAQVLAKLYAPAAVILDLLLPDMTGHKLLGQLASRGGPQVFVITGVFKGQTQMDKVRAVAPIAGWYEKPFDTRLLVEQVVRVIGNKVVQRDEHKKVGQVTPDFDINILDPLENEGIRARAGDAGKKDELEIEVDVDNAFVEWEGEETPLRSIDELSAVGEAMPAEPVKRSASIEIPLEELAPPKRGESVEIVLDDILGGATPLAEKHPSVQAPGPKTPAGGFDLKNPPPRFPPPMRPPSGPAAPAQAKPAVPASGTTDLVKGLRAKMRSGALKPTTVARLLTAFHISQETGEIAFERGTERKVVYLHEGKPVYARSNQDSDRLGAIARKAFGLTQQQIEKALEIARATDRMIGEVLIEQKMIDQAKRPDLVREQTRAIIRSLLTWHEGRYVIGFNAGPELERAALKEHPASLVLSAIREQLPVEKLRQLLPDRMHPMPAPNPPFELHELPMGDSEALLLLRATGKRSVRRLVHDIAQRLDEQAARAHIFALLALGVLVGRPQPQEQKEAHR